MAKNKDSIKQQERIMIRLACAYYNGLEKIDKEKMKSYILSAHDEIAEAGKSIDIDVLKKEEIEEQIEEQCDTKEDWSKRSSLKELLRLCKINAVMPYYLSKIVACVLYYVYVKHIDDSICSIIDKEGIKAGLNKALALDLEPQLLELIEKHYQKIQFGVFACEDDNKVAQIKQAYKKGFTYEKNFGGCAQCTIAGLCDALGLEKDPLLLSATSLSGGGSSRIDGSCGAYSASLMFLNRYVVGRSFDELVSGNKENYNKASELCSKIRQKFINTYDTVICQEVQKDIFGRYFYLWKEEDSEDFVNEGAHIDKCTVVVATACAWVMELLFDEDLLPLT
jgi:hypothetical protein